VIRIYQGAYPTIGVKDYPANRLTNMGTVIDFAEHKERIDRENQLNDDSRLMLYILFMQSDDDFQNDYKQLHDEIELRCK